MMLRSDPGRLPRTALWAALVLSGLVGSCHRLPPAGAPTGTVVRVLDGDTIEVLMGGRPVRVRLEGVDCPERGQGYAAAARRFTGELCLGQRVTLRTFGTDRYGRLLAELILPDGRVLNQELVRAGLAWWHRQHAAPNTVLAGLEAEARAARRGLWSEPEPLPPWDFRRGQRRKSLPRPQAGR